MILFTGLFFSACNNQSNTNVLTEEELKEGWSLLFNGQDLQAGEISRERVEKSLLHGLSKKEFSLPLETEVTAPGI